jgi:gluconolactonase
MSVEVALKNIFHGTGEGPHWDENENALYFVDLADKNHPDGRIFKWTPADNHVEERSFDKQFVTFVIPCEEDANLSIISLDQTIGIYDWTKDKFTQHAQVDDGKKTRFNDGKCDPRGRIWAGTMSLEKSPAVVYEEGSGSLYSFTTSTGVQHHDDNITISNGLAWTSDNKRMFYIDSFPRKVYAYDFNEETGEINNRSVLKDFSVLSIEDYGFPDGCCIDTEDRLWVAMYNAGKVVVLNTTTGDIEQEILLPAKRITSVCFGGENYDILYVTSGLTGLTEDEFKNEQPLAGSIFKVTGLNARGSKAQKFKL